MHVRLVTNIDEVSANSWNALAGTDDPFVEHGFLHTLEASGSVGPATGWEPIHVTVWDDQDLVGALPLYLKTHSYGEYTFDFTWARAAAQLGVRYYPKLVSMVPLTPVTGRRLLLADRADRSEIVQALLTGCRQAADDTQASSIHLLYLTSHERDDVRLDADFMPRLSQQFHWHNRGYTDFEGYLSEFRSSMRKQVRRERRGVAASGLEVRVVEGPDLTRDEWEDLSGFYRLTCARYGSEPYLTDDFFRQATTSLCTRAVAVLAYRGDRRIGGSINFEKGKHVYGRYWGATEPSEFLHFELCYYRLIERAIGHGAQRFEAGAQGIHKLRRGLMPHRIWSAHWIRDPILQRVVADYLPRERLAVERQILELSDHGPFRRDQPAD